MRVLVTGAGGAIGSEIVRQLVADGTAVLAQDIDSERLFPLQAGASTTSTAGDLLDPAYQAELRKLVEAEGVDSVIAAHGIDGSGSIDAVNPEFLRRVMAVNAQSVNTLLHVALPAFRREGGTFVVIASQAGLQAEADNAAYCAAKFAVVGWVRRLAPHLAAEQVQLRAFCPGCTETPLLFAAQERFAEAQGVPASSFVAHRRERIPIQRFAHVSETAAGAIYLASREPGRPMVLGATGGEVLY